MARVLFQFVITYVACFASMTRVHAAPWSPSEEEFTTEHPVMEPSLQDLLAQSGQASSVGEKNATGSSEGMAFDFSGNQGNSGQNSPPVGMTFDFSMNKPPSGSDGQTPNEIFPWEVVEPDGGDDNYDDWDQVLEDLFSPDCDETCEDFDDVCSGADECKLLENCTAVCHKADGTQSVLNPKDSAVEISACGQCVHGKCLDDQRCVCDVGYEGDRCDVKQCMLPCLHGGTCFAVRPRQYACACTPEWQGSFCQDEKCTLPCVRGSCLYWQEDGSPFCNCPYGWTGDFCEEKIPDPAASSKKVALIVGTTVPVVCILSLIISWYILWRKRVLFVFKIINIFKAYEDDDDKLYDAYVSLTDADFEFVKHILQPRLEAMGHKLYLHARDGSAGDVKSEEILEAVEKSRRCIMLLSSDYISNEWCRFEYLIAQHETCIKLKQRIIPIVMDDIDKDKKKMDKTLRFIVDSVKCLRYPRLPQELSPVPTSITHLQPDSPKSKELVKFEKKQSKFWERLRLNMPKKRDTGKEGCPLSAGTAKPPYSNQNKKKGLGGLFNKLSQSLPVRGHVEKSSSTDFSMVDPTSSSEKLSEANPVSLLSVTARVDPKLDSFYGDTLERSLTGDCSESSFVIHDEGMKGVATEDEIHIHLKV